jgi:alanyl-tRNA synthetase
VTQKLYYNDVYLKAFRTTGVKQSKDHDGNWYIVLADTAFYPAGGGQPHDTGTLNGVRVTNVEEEDGEIRHYLESELDKIDKIDGVIDWERRFDHMQQHSGQHILTAAFVELFQLSTVSFHLGKETSTIDIDTNQLTEEMLLSAEKRANEILRENRSIETKWVTEEEALQYNLRKELSVKEDIRLVIIPEYDYNGCGGTHPSSTGEVGSIKILDWEKQKNKARVRFVCGDRVLEQLHKKHSIILDLSRLLSVPEGELTVTAEKLLDNNKWLGKTIDDLRDQLLQFEADELVVSASKMIGEQRVICKVFQNRTIQQLQKLARVTAKQSEDANIFLIAENGSQLQFVCTRGPSATINMKELVKQILPLMNGKGGGNETAAQGGGEAIISGEELLDKILSLI